MTKLRTHCIVLLFCAVAVIAAPAQSIFFTSLASFDGSDGGYPGYMSLVQGGDGNFYGTTMVGGANFDSICFPGGSGCGTVFKVTASGVISALYSFCAQANCADGASPWAGLVLGSDGDFYGTTYTGGANNCYGGSNNCGTVFKVSSAGALTTVHSFNGADGAQPSAALVQVGGSFYGTTVNGGANGAGGTVFRMTPNGTLTTLYSFCSQANCTDGHGPSAPLVQGSDGNLYGTTEYGGAYDAGTVFKMTPAGALTTLYSFCSQPNCTDGEAPSAGLVQAPDGNFYGTTWLGGSGPCMYGCGTVFKINPTSPPGQGMTMLHRFQGYPAEGASPAAGLVRGRDGNFYGTTRAGGANYGTVFKVTSAGTLTTLHVFCVQGICHDGSSPLGGLLQAGNGFLYGTTQQGGAYSVGTVFIILVPPGQCATCRP